MKQAQTLLRCYLEIGNVKSTVRLQIGQELEELVKKHTLWGWFFVWEARLDRNKSCPNDKKPGAHVL